MVNNVGYYNNGKKCMKKISEIQNKSFIFLIVLSFCSVLQLIDAVPEIGENINIIPATMLDCNLFELSTIISEIIFSCNTINMATIFTNNEK